MEVERLWAFLTQLQRLYREEYRLHQNQRLIALDIASSWHSWEFLRENYPDYRDIIDEMYSAATDQ